MTRPSPGSGRPAGPGAGRAAGTAARQTDQARTGVGRARWTIGGLLGFGMFVNYLDRVNLSVAAPALMDDFGLSAGQVGLLSSAFLWTYAVLQLPVGSVLDRIGANLVTRVAVALWAVASFLTAAAGGLGLLLVARLLLGVGEVPTVPAGWKATGQWFPREERGTALAVFDGCAKMSNVLGVPLMAWLVSAYGWRAAFVFTGAFSLLYLAAWCVLYASPRQARARGRLGEEEYAYVRAGATEDEEAGADRADAGRAGSLAGLGHLLRRRKTWGLALGYASYTYAYYVLLTWLPTYLEKRFGANLLQGGFYTVIPWLVAVVAQFTVSWLVMDRWSARTGQVTRVRRIVLVVSLLVSLAVTGAAFAHTIAVALVFLSVGAAGLAVSVPAGSGIVSIIAPEGYTGSLAGIVNFVANLLGIAAPVVTGFVVDATGSFAGAFVVTGAVLVAGIVCYTVVLGRMDRMPGPAAAVPGPPGPDGARGAAGTVSDASTEPVVRGD